MSSTTSCATLAELLEGDAPFALIDVRDAGEYNSSHIPGSSLIPRGELEFRIADSVPFRATPIIVCDDDGRRAGLAADTLSRLGYSNVAALDGGMNRWVTEKRPTEWGVNVPSKDFGEKVQVQHGVPEIDAVELHSRIENGEKMVILDTRTPEEFQRFCIPGGRSVPNGELGLRITDIVEQTDDDTTVVINCAGRTRSIIGARLLQRMGLQNVVGLENGTAGWELAGYELETGADRVFLPEPSGSGRAAAEQFADRLAEQDGVRYIDVPTLEQIVSRAENESVYLIDVRAAEEYLAGHIPGFRWFPGGQAVQRSDEVAVAHNAPVVFCCDGRTRAALTASWYRQMGFGEIYALHGGTGAWVRAGSSLESGAPVSEPLGLAEAREWALRLSPEQVEQASGAKIIHVGLSSEFARGHIPGSSWVPRGRLEFRIENAAPDKSAPIIVTCSDPRTEQSILAAATLLDMGYADVTILDGGMRTWQDSGREIGTGLSGVMSPPTDMVASGPDRNFADMVNYLRWEEELGHKYAPYTPSASARVGTGG